MKSKKTTDLPDSEKDKRHLKSEEFEIDLPQVKDISADEQDEVSNQFNANVTKDERKVLDDAAGKINSTDQQNLDSAQLDQYDEDGELLNEKTGLSGKDLDVPGSELDDDNEDIGEEDEENNPYSLDEENEDTDINTRQ